MDTSIPKTELKETLLRKLKILNETTWENRANRANIEDWLSNFINEKERYHALFLLSHFMYFNSMQMRTLLQCLYRDLFKYSIIELIRKTNSNTVDTKFIHEEYKKHLQKTRFLGVGNPSESGVHLLYYFRQENKLPKELFLNVHQIIDRKDNKKIQLQNPDIKYYVFIDDFCGSGDQAVDYSESIVNEIKSIDSKVKVFYLMLFSTTRGKGRIHLETKFDKVESVFELSDSFKCFNSNSRYFQNTPEEIDYNFVKHFTGEYGKKLMRSIIMKEKPYYTSNKLDMAADKNKLGFKDGQLLIGFHHNTPDNSLPIFWYDEEEVPWKAIFRRYNKNYGLI